MLTKRREHLAFFKGSATSGARSALAALHDPASGFIALLKGTTPQVSASRLPLTFHANPFSQCDLALPTI